MVDDPTQQSLVDKIRQKIAEHKPEVPEKRDSTRRSAAYKATDDEFYAHKKCPACNEEFADTNLVVCPRDRTMLLTPQYTDLTWIECAKQQDRSIKRCPKCKQIYLSRYKKCKKDKTELEPTEFSSLETPIIEKRYQLLSYLETDRLFESFTARDLTENKIVAVHILSEILRFDSKSVTRFLKLGNTAIGLVHPNLLSPHSVNVETETPLSGYGVTFPAPYLVSDYVVSNSLETEIKTRQWFDTATASKIFIDILSALSHAHENGITHGAISTNNLRVAGGDGNRAIGLLTNFGLSERLFQDLEWDRPSVDTGTSSIYGDPDGLCPEFCKGLRPSTMTDQYQIGCALYYALCGKPPFERPALTQVLLAHAMDKPDDIKKKNKAIPDAMVRVILRCLEKDPLERYPSAQALSAELKQFMKN